MLSSYSHRNPTISELLANPTAPSVLSRCSAAKLATLTTDTRRRDKRGRYIPAAPTPHRTASGGIAYAAISALLIAITAPCCAIGAIFVLCAIGDNFSVLQPIASFLYRLTH